MNEMSADRDGTKQNIVANLGRLMAARKFNQSELARRAGIPKKTVQQTVTGYSLPSIAVVRAIAEALGVSIDEIVGDPESAKRVRRGPRFARVRAGRRLAAEARG